MKKSDWIKVDWTKEGGFPDHDVPVLVYRNRRNAKVKNNKIIAHIKHSPRGDIISEAEWVNSSNGSCIPHDEITHFQYLPDDPE